MWCIEVTHLGEMPWWGVGDAGLTEIKSGALIIFFLPPANFGDS